VLIVRNWHKRNRIKEKQFLCPITPIIQVSTRCHSALILTMTMAVVHVETFESVIAMEE